MDLSLLLRPSPQRNHNLVEMRPDRDDRPTRWAAHIRRINSLVVAPVAAEDRPCVPQLTLPVRRQTGGFSSPTEGLASVAASQVATGVRGKNQRVGGGGDVSVEVLGQGCGYDAGKGDGPRSGLGLRLVEQPPAAVGSPLHAQLVEQSGPALRPRRRGFECRGCSQHGRIVQMSSNDLHADGETTRGEPRRN